MIGLNGGIDVSEVFSVDLVIASEVVSNGINLVDEDGLVWLKSRTAAQDHFLVDTVNPTKFLSANSTQAESSSASILAAFNSDGYTVGTIAIGSGVGWTFRKSPKFFDVIRYLGDGANRTIPHGLTIQGGVALIKHTDGAGNNDWAVQHIARGGLVKTKLNLPDAEIATGNWNNLTMDEDNIYLGAGTNVNANGSNYVMYLFAHDTSPTGVIRCGQYTGTGATGVQVELGWVPQYVMIKSVSIVTSDWFVFDTTRGINGTSPYLTPNTSAVEVDTSLIILTATGFEINNTLLSANGADYIYMAIRAE